MITKKPAELAGLKAAMYLAKSVYESGRETDKTEVYEVKPFTESMKSHAALPKVAYLYMLRLRDCSTIPMYTVSMQKDPSDNHPSNETMDGAIVSGNCVSACDKNSTYVHLNNPVIKSLYSRNHGVDINLSESSLRMKTLPRRQKRSSSFAVKIAGMFRVDGLVISEEGFGNPDADLIMNCRRAK